MARLDLDTSSSEVKVIGQNSRLQNRKVLFSAMDACYEFCHFIQTMINDYSHKRQSVIT